MKCFELHNPRKLYASKIWHYTVCTSICGSGPCHVSCLSSLVVEFSIERCEFECHPRQLIFLCFQKRVVSGVILCVCIVVSLIMYIYVHVHTCMYSIQLNGIVCLCCRICLPHDQNLLLLVFPLLLLLHPTICSPWSVPNTCHMLDS